MNSKQPSTQRANSKMRYRVGIDTGGTFTDIVLVDDASGAVEAAKVESTPSDPRARRLERPSATRQAARINRFHRFGNNHHYQCRAAASVVTLTLVSHERLFR